MHVIWLFLWYTGNGIHVVSMIASVLLSSQEVYVHGNICVGEGHSNAYLNSGRSCTSCEHIT